MKEDFGSGHEIFSNEIPMPKSARREMQKQAAEPAKPAKRKYTRRAKPAAATAPEIAPPMPESCEPKPEQDEALEAAAKVFGKGRMELYLTIKAFLELYEAIPPAARPLLMRVLPMAGE